jgi:hypothetical protein
MNRSRRELSIGIALGARPRSLRAMVVGRSLAVVASGLALGHWSYGGARSFLISRHEGEPLEQLVGGAVVFLVLLTTAVSTYLPARKAAHVDRVVALRSVMRRIERLKRMRGPGASFEAVHTIRRCAPARTSSPGRSGLS